MRTFEAGNERAMIGRLCGQVLIEELDGTVTLDVSGVGYEVTLPLGTLGRAERSSEGHVVLIVHTRLRQDSLELYGFASELERTIFRLLLTVPNVGPKIALGVLSQLPPTELARALEQRDLARLNKIAGVGKKTAERLILELREKLPQLTCASHTNPASRVDSAGEADRLRGALTNMGYKPGEAERAVASLDERIGKEPLTDLLRAALAFLSR